MIVKRCVATVVLVTAITAIASSGAYAQGTGHWSDTAATVIALSPKGSTVTLTGVLQRAYVTPPSPVFVNGHTERRQQYIFLHLEVPVDFLHLVGNKKYQLPVMHQYDVQVMGSAWLVDPLLSHCVTITGTMWPFGLSGGSPASQPFPLSIFPKQVRPVATQKGRCVSQTRNSAR